jgi:three-Cys-motif partner protein
MPKSFPYDEIGDWSEIKLDIIREYATAYSKIMAGQASPPLHHVYIDAFAGAGVHISRSTGDFVPGSPLNAMLVKPPFKEYHFIDLEKTKTEALREVVGDHEDVFIWNEDCNEVLLETVFPKVRYDEFRRALCLLDPYGLNLKWQIIRKAGAMKTIEIFLNFPIMDINRNVLRTDPEKVDPIQQDRMDSFWGDRSWHEAAYEVSQLGLFGDRPEKTSNEAIIKAFRHRLTHVAGFEYVPDPMPIRNSQNAVVYFLFFASQKPVADTIVSAIFKKYRKRLGTR